MDYRNSFSDPRNASAAARSTNAMLSMSPITGGVGGHSANSPASSNSSSGGTGGSNGYGLPPASPSLSRRNQILLSSTLSPLGDRARISPSSMMLQQHQQSLYPPLPPSSTGRVSSGGGGGSSANDRFRLAYKSQPMQQQQQPSTRLQARAGQGQQQRPPISARLGGNTRTAYRRKRFLVFMKVLLKILRRDSMKHPQLYLQAKAIVADCTRRNRYKDPQYCPLPEAVERRLRPMVGEAQWKRANACLDLYLEKRRQMHVVSQQQQQQQQRAYAAAAASYYGAGASTAVGARGYYGGGGAPIDPLEVLPEIQNQHRRAAVAAAAAAAVRGNMGI